MGWTVFASKYLAEGSCVLSSFGTGSVGRGVEGWGSDHLSKVLFIERTHSEIQDVHFKSS
jgi:hypothetical protein